MTSEGLIKRHGQPWRVLRLQTACRQLQRWLLLLVCWVPPMAYSSLPGEVSLPGTVEFTLLSPTTGQDYLIQVSIPDSPPPETGYSVMYLLDGNARFALVQAARDTLTRQGPDGDSDALMIVAIGYPDTERFNKERRVEDFTPLLPNDGVAENDYQQRPHGGADRFLSFIEGHLKPEINRRFAINTEQEAIFGHSLGGLFVLHALLTQPSSFDRYIAISPSLWWYGERPLAALAQQTSSLAAIPSGTRLLIGVGEREQPASGDVVTPRDRRMQARAMVDNAQSVAEWLSTQQRNLEVGFTLFPGETHGSVMWPATRQAIEFLVAK